MPDLQNFSVTAASAVNVNVPRFTISCQVVQGATVLADFTGANAIQFPSVLSTLSAAQRRELVDLIANTIVYQKAGL